MNSFKSILINDTDGFVNIGCNLTSKGLKKHLISSFQTIGVDLTVDSVPYQFGRNKNALDNILKNNKKFSLRNIDESIGNEAFLLLLKKVAQLEYGDFERWSNVDLVFFQAEGTLGGNPSFKKIFCFFSLPLYFSLIGKKVVYLNGTVPEVFDKSKDFLNFCFSASFYTCFRDRLSSIFWGRDFLPDAAFGYTRSVKVDNVERNFVLITTGARNSLDIDARIVENALKFCKIKKLTPLVLTKSSKNFSLYKEEILSMGGIFMESCDLQEAEKLINKCVLHIGGRYHMAILCLKLGVPSMVYSIETHKNKWLSEEFEDVHIFDMNSDILGIASDLLQKRLSVLGQIARDVQQVEEKFISGINNLTLQCFNHSLAKVQNIFWSES